MTRKTQAEYNREHLARLRRKAKAFDRLVMILSVVPSFAQEAPAVKPVTDFIERAVSDAKTEAAE